MALQELTPERPWICLRRIKIIDAMEQVIGLKKATRRGAVLWLSFFSYVDFSRLATIFEYPLFLQAAKRF